MPKNASLGPTAERSLNEGADALGGICRKWLDSTDRPQVSGERPHVTIMVDLEALEGRSGFRCELGDAGTITAETARRWACDASNRPGHHHGQVRAARGGTPHPGGAGFPAPGSGGPGRRLPVPRVRPSSHVVRCPPRSALGRRRVDLALESDPSVPAASPDDPSAVQDGDVPRQTRVPSAGWLTSGGSRAAYIWAMSCSTRSSTERKGSLHSTVRCAWSFSFRWTQSTV
jgi:hypothetical protein